MRAAAAVVLVAALLGGAPAGAAVLRIGNGAEPESLDPQKAESVSAGNILRDLYEGLTGVAPDGRIVAAAAASWETSADGRTWTFHLRPEGRWSSGEPVVAEDFVAALRRAVDPATGCPSAQMLAPIENAAAIVAGRLPPDRLGARAPDPHTVELRLQAPTPYLPGVLAQPAAFPLHRGAPGTPVGNGAYRLDTWAMHAQLSLVRNPHYWNDAATRIDRVVYHPTEDLNAELARYRAGELDVTFQIPLVQARWIRAQLGGELRIAPYLGLYYYGFNLTRPPFAGNADLRRALSLAVDRELIVDKVMNGLALPAWSWIPPGTHGAASAPPPWAAWPRQRRLDEARRLYAAAGYGPQRPLRVEIRYNTHEDHRRIATVIAAMWKQNLGVDVRLVNEEAKVFLAHRRQQLTQVFRASWIGDYDDASSFTDILGSAHGQNFSRWRNADYDARIAAAAGEADPARRAELLADAERLVADEVPAMPIYFYVSKHLVKPRVRGWQDNVLDYHYTKDLDLAPH